jgi:hypothetical protein
MNIIFIYLKYIVLLNLYLMYNLKKYSLLGGYRLYIYIIFIFLYNSNIFENK